MKKILACAFAALIVLVIILAAVVMIPTSRRYRDFLTGMWVGDPAFLSKAGLSDMQLFISPVEGGSRQGYLLMADENRNLIANQAFDMVARGGGWRQGLADHFCAHDRHSASAELTFDGDFDLIPSDLTLTLSMSDGSLTLRNEEKLFGFLWKNHAASAAAARAYEARESGDDDADDGDDADNEPIPAAGGRSDEPDGADGPSGEPAGEPGGEPDDEPGAEPDDGGGSPVHPANLTTVRKETRVRCLGGGRRPPLKLRLN